MASVLPLHESIVKGIQDVCKAHSLNASNIQMKKKHIVWTSSCGGVIGFMTFKIPIFYFEESIESGVNEVSAMISFTALVCKEENKGLAININRGNMFGAPHYFIHNTKKNKIIAYIAHLGSVTYTTLDIEYEKDDETGIYTWTIPEQDSMYSPILCDEVSKTYDYVPEHYIEEAPEECPRQVTEYSSIGLGNTQSPGLPMRNTSSIIRGYSGVSDTEPRSLREAGQSELPNNNDEHTDDHIDDSPSQIGRSMYQATLDDDTDTGYPSSVEIGLKN